MRLYGSRPRPPEAIGTGEIGTLPTELPVPPMTGNRIASAKRKPNQKGHSRDEDLNYTSVTSMDWNSGMTHLDAWLNSSAMPSVTPPEVSRPTIPNAILVRQEQEELKLFRKVHIRAFKPSDGATDVEWALSNFDEKLLRLGPKGSIYARNITERYPDLPQFLVFRLAKASCVRAAKLSLLRERLAGADRRRHFAIPSKKTAVKLKAAKAPRMGKRKEKDQGNLDLDTVFEIAYAKLLKLAKEATDGGRSRKRRRRTGDRKGLRSVGFRRKRGIRDREDESCSFWSGRGSVGCSASPSSVRNNSLYGSDIDYASDQDPSFVSCGGSPASLSSSKSSFLSPLVDLDLTDSFNCDICGQPLECYGRREWQSVY